MLAQLIAKYRDSGLLIDTNLLVGLVVGSMDRKLIATNRAAIRPLTEEDFDLLIAFANRFKHLITTPHILTELSNLTGKLPSHLHKNVRMVIKRLVLRRTIEENVSAAMVVEHDLFSRFGMADTAIHLIAPNKYLVLTDEFALAQTLGNRGVDVVNFNHIRMLDQRAG